MEWYRNDEIDVQSGGRGNLFLIGDSAKPIGAQRLRQPRLLVSCRHPCQLELRPGRQSGVHYLYRCYAIDGWSQHWLSHGALPSSVRFLAGTRQYQLYVCKSARRDASLERQFIHDHEHLQWRTAIFAADAELQHLDAAGVA